MYIDKEFPSDILKIPFYMFMHYLCVKFGIISKEENSFSGVF